MDLVGREHVTARAHRFLERATGILLVGPGGIGKSALAEQLGSELADQGSHVEHVPCSEMTKSVPFAPLMHVFPRATAPDPTQLSRSLIDTILARAGDRPLLLLIDDLQHSDPGTAAVIISLVTHHDAKVIASTRPADTITPSVQSLWKDGHLERIDLRPLPTAAVAKLAEQLTGTPLTPTLRTELARRADGNPFYTIALTRVGLGSGAIQEHDGVSELVRPLPVSAEIADVLRSQMSALAPAARTLVEMIALGENMPIEVFGEIEEQQLIEGLIAGGLVLVDRSTDTHATRCAHPLIGEYARSHLPRGRRKRIHESLVARIAQLDYAAPLDLLRAASIALASDIVVDARLLLEASRTAINVAEFDLALQAALAASSIEDSAQSHLLAGTALWMTGQVAQAHEHLDQVAALGPDEEQRARLAIARSNIAVFFEQSPDRSEALLQAAYAELTSPALRMEMGAMMIFPLTMSGRADEAVALGTELMQLGPAEPHVEVQVLGMLAMAKFLIGSFDEMQTIIDRAASIKTNGGAQSLMFASQMQTAEFALRKASLELGSAEDYVKSLADLYVVTPKAGGASNVWSSQLTTVQCLTGNLGDALEHTSVALEETMVADDPLGTKPMLVAARAAALAQANELKGATEIIAAISDDYALTHRRAALWKGWALTWITGQTNTFAGAELAAQWGRYGMNNCMNYWAWDVLHAAVRLGHPGVVVDSLEQEAQRAAMPLVSLFARHARALAEQDQGALLAIAHEFTEKGAWACCAEIHASLAQLADDGPQARIAHLRGSLAAAHTTGASTPLLRSLVNPLSEHETNVAQRAAAGHTSKEIADARFVSARTVDNQLRSVYKKLGLNGRADLASILLVAGRAQRSVSVSSSPATNS